MSHLTPENRKIVHKEVLAAIQVDEGSECDRGETYSLQCQNQQIV